MFNNIFCEMNIKKIISWEGLWKWGNLPNFLFEVEFQVYANIQAISTLVCLLILFDDNGFEMCNYSILTSEHQGSKMTELLLVHLMECC